jgi:hypothetical protein
MVSITFGEHRWCHWWLLTTSYDDSDNNKKKKKLSCENWCACCKKRLKIISYESWWSVQNFVLHSYICVNHVDFSHFAFNPNQQGHMINVRWVPGQVMTVEWCGSLLVVDDVLLFSNVSESRFKTSGHQGLPVTRPSSNPRSTAKGCSFRFIFQI